MPNCYTLIDSPFYKLQSKRQLAEILFTSEKLLLKLRDGEGRYRIRYQDKKKGGKRKVCNPIPSLKRVQKRIANLLNRVKAADFVYASVPGRSYIDNAAQHVGVSAIHCLDIADYFPHCTFNRAWWFFNKMLLCSLDVSFILASLSTFQGSLPQGSPCSPILSYYFYMDMWAAINAKAKAHSCIFTLYIDDVTISGRVIPEMLIWDIKQIIRKYGHLYKKDKEYAVYNRPIEITGVIVEKNGLKLPNRQYKKRYEAKKELSKASGSITKKKLRQQIAGRETQILQIQQANASLKKRQRN